MNKIQKSIIGTSLKREARKCLHYAIRRAYKEMGKEETRKMLGKYMPKIVQEKKDD